MEVVSIQSVIIFIFWNNECLCVYDTGLRKRDKPTISQTDENPEDDDEVLFLFDSRSLPTAESVSVISSEMHEKEKEREVLKQSKNSIQHIAFQPFVVNYIIPSIYSQTRWLTRLHENTSSFVLIGERKHEIGSWISIEFWQSSTCLHPGPGYQIGRRGGSELPAIQRPNQVLQSNLAIWRRFWQWTWKNRSVNLGYIFH